MQQLHLVGITTELDGLIFSARRGARSGSFVVPLNEELIESIGQLEKMRQDLRPAVEGADDQKAPVSRVRIRSPRPESRLTPREMQARLRAGHSVAEVARAAAVDDEWVERWAAPIEAEQARVLEMALGLHAANPRTGLSALPLGDSVRVNLHDRGVPLMPALEGWSAHNLGGSRWAVQFEYVSRRRRQVAEWDLDLDSRELIPRTRLAGEIGHLNSSRRRVPLPPPPVSESEAGQTAPEVPTDDVMVRTAPARKAPARKARKAPARKARTAASQKAPARKAPSPKAASGRAPARKATKSAARKAVSSKTPARKATARKAAPRKAAGRKAAPRKAAGRKAPVKKSAPVRKKAPAGRSGVRKAPGRRTAARRTR